MKVENGELESLRGPEDSEVDLRQIMRYASRKGGRIFELFSSKGKSEHLAASRVRWDDRQSPMATQEEEARRNVQEVDDEINQNWTAAYQWVAKRMLKYLEDSGSLERKHQRIEGTSSVSKRVERQHRAHCEAGKK